MLLTLQAWYQYLLFTVNVSSLCLSFPTLGLFQDRDNDLYQTSGIGTAPLWCRANVLKKLKCRNTKSKFKNANKAVNGDVWSSNVGKKHLIDSLEIAHNGWDATLGTLKWKR